MPFRHKRRSPHAHHQDIRAIYTGKDGKIPDLTRLARKKNSRLTSFLLKTIGILFVLSLVAWGGFFLFNRGWLTQNETIAVDIQTADTIRAGEETTFQIAYENSGDVPIASLILKLNLPQSFHPTSFLPEPNQQDEWVIGALTPHSDGMITVKGVFLSEVPSTQRIQALLTYKPANFSSDFQEIKSKTIELNESALELALEGPDKALAGDAVEYTIKLKHTGKDPIYNVRVVPELPQDFVIEKTTPEISKEHGYWEIPVLEPQKLLDVTLRGTFTSTASGSLKMGVHAGFVDEDEFFVQVKSDVITEVLGGAVNFHLILDGSSENRVIQPGKTIRGSIDYKNPGKDPVEGISFILNTTATGTIPIDWDKAELSGGKRSGNSVTWNKEQSPPLGKLDAGKEGVIDFTLPLLASAGTNSSDAFTVNLSMRVERVGSVESTRIVDATPITFSVASDVSLKSEARYFNPEGAPIGSGELPPKVGAQTSYRIFWQLNNSLHDLGNVEVSTILPQDVTWKEATNAEIGTISYNSTTRQVKWQVGKLPSSIKQAGAWFDLSITPKSADVGKFVKLTNQTAVVATDLTTQSQTNSSQNALTTELSTDEFASGKGTVVK